MKKTAAFVLTLLFLFSPHLGYIFSSQPGEAGSRPARYEPMPAALALDSITYCISRASATSVSAEIQAKTKQTADKVEGIMYLQQWSDRNWNTIESKCFFASSDDHDACSARWTVSSGYFYRLTAVFSVGLESQSITRTANTGAIWVN